MTLPRYADLPPAPGGGRSAWGVFGAGDQVGTLNLQNPVRIAEAARLVRRGAVFPLNGPLDAFGHEQWGRRLFRHEVVHEPGQDFFDDLLHDFGPQGSSQWDSPGHVAYSPGSFYNGATEEEVAAGQRNTIDHVARRGIAGRGVVLDMVRTAERSGWAYDPLTTVPFGVPELEAALELTQLELTPGDLLLLHTGFGRAFAALGAPALTATPFISPGLAYTEDVVRSLWDHQVSAIASDNLAIEAWPIDLGPEAFPFGALHNMLIGELGLTLGELWELQDLADVCARDGRYEVFVVSAPLHLVGGIGSPANALALK